MTSARADHGRRLLWSLRSLWPLNLRPSCPDAVNSAAKSTKTTKGLPHPHAIAQGKAKRRPGPAPPTTMPTRKWRNPVHLDTCQNGFCCNGQRPVVSPHQVTFGYCPNAPQAEIHGETNGCFRPWRKRSRKQGVLQRNRRHGTDPIGFCGVCFTPASRPCQLCGTAGCDRWLEPTYSRIVR